MERARARTALLLVCLAICYGLLALRASAVMLFPDQRLVTRARAQFQKAVSVEAPRGPILDRNGDPLAISVEMPSIRADPSALPPDRVRPLARELSGPLGVDVETLARKLGYHHRKDVALALQVNPDRVEEILALGPDRVLFARDELARFYPERELAAQVLGVVGRSGRGLEGLERSLDRYLFGTTWRFIQQRDLKGRALSSPQRPTLSGGEVTLTLDRHIQQAAEDALDLVVEASAPHTAVAVVMDVRTGELLAVATRPTTNPNDRYRRDTDALQDQAARAAHEPGSVMKPFVMAQVLELGLGTPETLIDCEGGRWRIGRTTIRDDHPRDVIPYAEVIQYSSNIGAAKLALKLGAERTLAGLLDFGFGAPTGAGLPHERRGVLRSAETIKPIELATTSYGQGMTATPLQLVSALATLGNGGVRMQPTLVSRVTDAWGETLVDNPPRELGRVVSEATADAVVEMMELVLADGGTGLWARIPGYTAAGKTGTAWKVVDGRYSPTARVSSFIGLTPANDPRLAIVVMVDTPTQGSRYGGPVAGPAFSLIAERSLRYLGVPADRLDEVDEDPSLAEVDPSEEEVLFEELSELTLTWVDPQTLRLPDLSGASLRDVLAAMDGAGLELALVGSGIATSQSPAAGHTVAVGDRLEVRFQ